MRVRHYGSILIALVLLACTACTDSNDVPAGPERSQMPVETFETGLAAVGEVVIERIEIPAQGQLAVSAFMLNCQAYERIEIAGDPTGLQTDEPREDVRAYVGTRENEMCDSEKFELRTITIKDVGGVQK